MDLFNFMDLAEKIVPVFKKMKSANEWENMFINTGKEIRDVEHDEGELFDQINILFSEDSLKSIAKENRSSGYELVEQVRTQLISFFTTKELYTDERRHYIDLFIDAFRNQLKYKFPEEYDKVFLNDFRNENKQDHLVIYRDVHGIVEKIDELKIYDINIITCDELNNWYITNTKNQCTLELFNHENKEFADKLLNELSKSTINIKGENVFETVAYIAYLFLKDERFSEYKDKLKIVEDEESWNKLSKSNFSNYIFVNRFSNTDNLEIIEKSKCVFVYGKNDYIKSKDYIELEKRFFRNLIDKVTQCASDDEEAYDISRASRNNYTILMRLLNLGKQKEPIWAKREFYNPLLPAMIINQWLDKDSVLFELLLNNKQTYADYIKELEAINNVQDPFVVKHKTRYNNNKYMISDPENVWDFFGDLINDSLFNKLEPMIDLILGEIDPKFELPVEKHYYASVLGYTPQFSDELKNGFIETLIYLSKTEAIGHSIKKKIRNRLNKINTNKDWFSISEILPSIFEIDPDAVLSKFEEELIKEESGLINLFIEKFDDFFTGRNYYTHVIWTLEKALYLDDFVFRAINILAKLMDLNIEYKISNSPLNTLYNALVAWSHQYVYSIDEKIEFVKYIVENTTNGWLLLKELLPLNRGGAVFSLSRPKYTSYLLSDELKWKDQVFDTYKKYYQIALDNVNGKVENLCVFYEDVTFFNFDIYEELKQLTLELIGKLSDQERYVLYKKVYSLISRNRHFQTAEWAQSEENIDRLENEILVKIIFQDESYKYQYIFESYHDVLLHPVIYKSDDNHNSIKENQKLEDELKRNSIKNLVELNINWSEFFKRFSTDSSNSIGVYLAEVKNDIVSIEEISKLLVDDNKLAILAAYYGSLYSKFGLNIVESFVKSKKLNEEQYLKLMLGRVDLDISTIDFLDKLDDKYKEIFWKINNAYSVKEEVRDDALNNYIIHKNANALIILANHYSYSSDKLIKVLEVIQESPIRHDQMTAYHIERIFEKIYEDNFPRVEISQQVMKLEIYFFPIFDNKNGLRYLRHNLSIDPNLSAEFIKYAFKNENESKEKVLNENEKRVAEISYSILSSVKFSPTNNGMGVIDQSTLKTWCNEYISAVTRNNQKKVGLRYLGHFLANTNIVKEGEFPQESVKQVIEAIFDEELLRGFLIEIVNSLGVRTISDGSDLLNLARKYDDYAQNSKMYPKTQKILNAIAESFYRDYESEKESAKYDD